MDAYTFSIYLIYTIYMNIINFISGKDLGGPKQSFILYSEVLINLGFEVRSVIRQGAPLKEIMQSMDIDVDEVS